MIFCAGFKTATLLQMINVTKTTVPPMDCFGCILTATQELWTQLRPCDVRRDTAHWTRDVFRTEKTGRLPQSSIQAFKQCETVINGCVKQHLKNIKKYPHIVWLSCVFQSTRSATLLIYYPLMNHHCWKIHQLWWYITGREAFEDLQQLTGPIPRFAGFLPPSRLHIVHGWSWMIDGCTVDKSDRSVIFGVKN